MLRYATLCYATLCCAVLCCAMLCCAVLRYATLCYAVLRYATLRYATLCCAMLCCAVLCFAMLCYAMLCFCHTCFCHAVHRAVSLQVSGRRRQHLQSVHENLILLSGAYQHTTQRKPWMCMLKRQAVIQLTYVYAGSGLYPAKIQGASTLINMSSRMKMHA